MKSARFGYIITDKFYDLDQIIKSKQNTYLNLNYLLMSVYNNHIVQKTNIDGKFNIYKVEMLGKVEYSSYRKTAYYPIGIVHKARTCYEFKILSVVDHHELCNKISHDVSIHSILQNFTLDEQLVVKLVSKMKCPIEKFFLAMDKKYRIFSLSLMQAAIGDILIDKIYDNITDIKMDLVYKLIRLNICPNIKNLTEYFLLSEGRCLDRDSAIKAIDEIENGRIIKVCLVMIYIQTNYPDFIKNLKNIDNGQLKKWASNRFLLDSTK